MSGRCLAGGASRVAARGRGPVHGLECFSRRRFFGRRRRPDCCCIRRTPCRAFAPAARARGALPRGRWRVTGAWPWGGVGGLYRPAMSNGGGRWRPRAGRTKAREEEASSAAAGEGCAGYYALLNSVMAKYIYRLDIDIYLSIYLRIYMYR